MGPNCALKPASYLNILSAEALWNILRYMSSFPHRCDWAAFISAADIHTLCRGTTSLSTLFRERMRTVSVLQQYDQLILPKNRIKISPNTSLQVGRIFKVSYDDLIYVLSPASSYMLGEESHFVKPQITELRLSNANHIPELLPMTSATLCSLRLLVPHYVAPRAWISLLDHSHGLRSLSLTGCLTSLPLARLWAVVGQSLESLEADLQTTNISTFFDDLGENCRNLRHINLNWIECEVESEFTLDDCKADFEALTHLYVSYGAQLESLTVDVLPVSYCSSIRHSCPNAKVRLYMFDEDDIDQLRVLSPLVSILSFESFDNVEPIDRDLWVSQLTGAEYQNLEQVDAFRLNARETDAILPHLLTFAGGNLEKLTFVQDDSDIMRIVAENCASLKSISVSIVCPEDGAFLRVAEANKGLEDVRIVVRERDVDGRGVDWVKIAISIISDFKPCAALRRFCVENYALPSLNSGCKSSEIANACIPFRCSGTHVKIWDVVYIP